MVNPGKARMKRKSKRVSSTSKVEHYRGKKGVPKCAVSGKKLAGTHTSTKGLANKKSKSQKRPSVPFGGVLGAKAREQVFIELGKVVAQVKTVDDVEQKYRKYVKQALKRAE
jgi:ribosomal protein L34E